MVNFVLTVLAFASAVPAGDRTLRRQDNSWSVGTKIAIGAGVVAGATLTGVGIYYLVEYVKGEDPASTATASTSKSTKVTATTSPAAPASPALAPNMTITSATAGVTNGNKTTDKYINVTFTSSTPTDDFNDRDVEVTNGVLTNFIGNGTVFNATFTPSKNGTTTIDVAEGSYTSGAKGTGNIAALRFTWTKITECLVGNGKPTDDCACTSTSTQETCICTVGQTCDAKGEGCANICTITEAVLTTTRAATTETTEMTMEANA